MAKIIFNLILLALICAGLLYVAAHYFVKVTENYIAKKKFDKLDLREAILIFPFLNMEDRSHHEFREDVFYYKFDIDKELFVLKRTKFAENLIGPIISYAPNKSKK